MNNNTTTYTLITWITSGNTPDIFVTRCYADLVKKQMFWYGYAQSLSGGMMHQKVLVDGEFAGFRFTDRLCRDTEAAIHG